MSENIREAARSFMDLFNVDGEGLSTDDIDPMELANRYEALWDCLSEQSTPATLPIVMGTWLPIDRADKEITNVEDFSEVGVTIRTSDRYWVRDDDGRVYEAAWSEGENGRNYWWDFEGESPVDPVEFMPHPLDPRFHTDAKLEDQP